MSTFVGTSGVFRRIEKLRSASDFGRLRSSGVSGADPEAVSKADPLRKILRVGFAPAAIALVAISAGLVALLFFADSSMAGLPSAIAMGWLGIHVVSVEIGGAELGVLPIAGMLLLGWATYRNLRAVITADHDPREIASLVGAAVAGPLLITAVALAVIDDAAMNLAIGHAALSTATGLTVAVHLIPAVLAVIVSRRDVVEMLVLVPRWFIIGFRGAVRVIRDIAVVAALVAVVIMVLNWPSSTTAAEIARSSSYDWGIGALTLAYLPNIIALTAAVLVGATAAVGASSVSLAAVSGEPSQAIALLASHPTGPAQTWWFAALLAPLLVGARLGWFARKQLTDKWLAARAALVAAVLAGLALAGVVAAASGNLGTVGWIGAPGAATGLMLTGWLTIGGGAVALLVRQSAPAVVAAPAEPLAIPAVAESVIEDADVVNDAAEAQPPAESDDAAEGADSEIVDAEIVELDDKD